MDKFNNPVPAIGVGAVIFNNTGSVLIIRRNKAPALGQWSVPGGKMEVGESLVNACRREVKEETGLDIELIGIIAVVERKIEEFHYVIVDFLAKLELDSARIPVAQSDVSDAQWVKLAELHGFELVDGLEEIINRAYGSLQPGTLNGLKDFVGNGTDFIPATPRC